MGGEPRRVVALGRLALLGAVVLTCLSLRLEAGERLRDLLLQKQQIIEKRIADYRSSEARAQERLARAQSAERSAREANNAVGAENARRAAELSQAAIHESRRLRAADEERLEAAKRAVVAATDPAVQGLPLVQRGEIEVVSGGRQTRMAGNQALREGDAVRVGRQGYLELQTEDGVLALGPNSSFTLAGRVQDARGFYDLLRGRLRVVTECLHTEKEGCDGRRRRHRVGTTVLTVRGTEFVVEASAEGATLIVFFGEVEVVAGKQTRTIRAGESLPLPAKGEPGMPEKHDPARIDRWWETWMRQPTT